MIDLPYNGGTTGLGLVRPIYEEDGTVVCPACGSPYTHQYRTEVYDRAEDANEGTLVVIEGDNAARFPDMRDCPSCRRGGLRIWIYCEWCPIVSAFAVIQHKGATIVGWEAKKSYEEATSDE